jgi:hypothetical protein
MQLVQTIIFLTRPLDTLRTRCKFGLNRRLVTLCAWLTLLPTIGFLPHISHAFDILNSPYSSSSCFQIENWVSTPNQSACKAFFIPLLIGFLLGYGGFTPGNIFKRFLIIPDIRVVRNDRHESVQCSFVMFGSIIKNADDISMTRKTFLGCFDVLGGSDRILIPGELLYQALKRFQRFLGRCLVSVRRIDLVVITSADLVDDIWDRLIARVELLKIFIGKYGFLIFLNG